MSGKPFIKIEHLAKGLITESSMTINIVIVKCMVENAISLHLC